MLNLIGKTNSNKLSIEQLNVFKDVKYYDDTHSYYYNNESFINVTSLIKKYQHDFNEEYWAKYKVLQNQGLQIKTDKTINVPKGFYLLDSQLVYYKDLDVDINKMIESWKSGSDVSKTKGTKYHKYLENAWNNKYETHDRIEVLDNIIKVLSSQYLPIKLEWIVADFDSRVAGQLDGFFYDIKNNKYVILDYKTDKEIKYFNRFQTFMSPLEFLSDCNYNKYTLQLNMYKHCIEKYVNITIDSMIIVWIKPDGFELITIPESQDLVKLIL
jgi:hypothetical protein